MERVGPERKFEKIDIGKRIALLATLALSSRIPQLFEKEFTCRINTDNFSSNVKSLSVACKLEDRRILDTRFFLKYNFPPEVWVRVQAKNYFLWEGIDIQNNFPVFKAEIYSFSSPIIRMQFPNLDNLKTQP